MDYNIKYIKYKNKYLNYKNLKGGMFKTIMERIIGIESHKNYDDLSQEDKCIYNITKLILNIYNDEKEVSIIDASEQLYEQLKKSDIELNIFLQLFGVFSNKINNINQFIKDDNTERYIMFINYDTSWISTTTHIYISCFYILQIFTTIFDGLGLSIHADIGYLVNIVLEVIFRILYSYKCNIIISKSRDTIAFIKNYIQYMLHNFINIFSKYKIYIYYNDYQVSTDTKTSIYLPNKTEKYTATVLSKINYELKIKDIQTLPNPNPQDEIKYIRTYLANVLDVLKIEYKIN